MITSPAYIHLKSMISKYEEHGSKCIPCSQDVSACSTKFGPFTGEVTAGMLKDFGVDWAIIGHSERREFSDASIVETREVINKKVKNALKAGLNVILCVGKFWPKKKTRAGEPKAHIDIRSSEYVIAQLESLLDGVDLSQKRLIVAYEPSYSVGTGEPVDPKKVNDIIAEIRKWLDTRAVLLKFIYGGSVDENNAPLYVKQDNIDGVMVSRIAHSEKFGKLLENIAANSIV
ncbi:hypothetical protein BEWA_009290 [Theileria equi strain WA]|uniref:Triosephosphate isomerase n=1 Tax=Theileria equi strain WA TaxID=1537102 RepID=L0B2R6_THEEQ|nr:hypothetical protein BEWA_009290 [Theileria equi strain WA]AFZ81516.1 hypothetical protein BEWA_009290 [Theileria equi strain WA]|eukprot:XP_004831182.1 hypothetical protein BEWA_009290 [Theileria equi strain WA]